MIGTFNGKTKAAIVAAACAVVGLAIGVYGGWSTEIARKGAREEKIDRHLVESAPLVPRFYTIEQITLDNQKAIAELRGEVSRLVDSQQRLTNTILDYMREFDARRRTP